MILSEIIAKLERRFPIENKENWDNVGQNLFYIEMTRDD